MAQPLTEDVTVVQSTEPPLEYIRARMQERPMCVQHPLADLCAVVDDMRLAGDTLWEARRGALVVAVAFCRVEADGLLLRECVYDDEAARDALIAGIAAHYGRTEVDVIRLAATEGDYFGMARIIDVQGMLAAYAALHPEADCVICVTDPLLIENDGCYRLAGGQCERQQTSVPEAQQHTIATLTDLLVAQENLLMTLMMND